MKQKIRTNIFETNSSSVHSLTLGNTSIDAGFMMDSFDDLTKDKLKIWFDKYIDENFDYLYKKISNRKSIVIDVDWESD